MKRNPVAPPKEICESTDPGVARNTAKRNGPARRRPSSAGTPIRSRTRTLNGTRTLRTVFTHDHFGPSTHQQTGLYAALLVEPTGSKWSQARPARRSAPRDDGGPTTWNAVIETPATGENTYREFALAMQDFQFAYRATSKTMKASSDPNIGWSDPSNAIDPLPQDNSRRHAAAADHQRRSDAGHDVVQLSQRAASAIASHRRLQR